jgi:hypothetical protein
MSLSENTNQPLNSQQVFYIRVTIFLMVGIVLGVWAYVGLSGPTKNVPKKTERAVSEKSGSVIYFKDQLSIFSQVMKINSYPDSIYIHDNIMLVVKPYDAKTHIFDTSTKQKVRTMDGIVLDYVADNVLFQKGASTLFNATDLGVSCEKGFIVSANEVLCIVKVDPNGIANKLISINPISRKTKIVYSSPRVLSAAAVIKGNTYIGEFDFSTGKGYLTINGVTIDAPDTVNIIYQMGESVYVGSIPGKFNNNTPSFAKIEDNAGIKSLKTVKRGLIVLSE